MQRDRLRIRETVPLYRNLSIGGHGLSSPITFTAWTCSAVSGPETRIAGQSRQGSALRVWASSVNSSFWLVLADMLPARGARNFTTEPEKLVNQAKVR
jgi:hypothetical protein